MTVRSPEEVFAAHGEAFGSADVDEIVANFADDAVVITPSGVRRGKKEIREGFVKLFNDLPDAAWNVPTQIFEGEILFLEWTAEAESVKADDGFDVFLIRDGFIRSQVIRYTLVPKS